MSSRRTFLKAAPMVIVSSPFTLAIAKAEDESCEFYIMKLAQAMEAIHGGEWQLELNHKSQIAMVMRSGL